MIRLAALAAALAVAAAAGVANGSAARHCQRVHLSWGARCIAAGQFCKVSADAEYHRFGYHCHTGRLSRSSAGLRKPAPGCEPGYSPCLPRVADLNCADIPASKRPVRVTGSDPYRLDGNHDGWGCTG
ncbi:MAG TPA: hypothetical protein VFJ91_10125 [Gaiellaceae bacterium]|nr:hypothetical protein [Gaiellaceae bacterium]